MQAFFPKKPTNIPSAESEVHIRNGLDFGPSVWGIAHIPPKQSRRKILKKCS
jgi:hypothetical protein